MKKVIAVLLAALFALCLPGCSCGKVEEPSSVPSTSATVPTTVRPTAPSVPKVVGDDFVSHIFEINAKVTSDWKKYSKAKDPLAVRFSLWVPGDWTLSENGRSFSAGSSVICDVLAPVLMSEGQSLPDIPGSESGYEAGTRISATDIWLSGMRGKLVIIRENDLSYRYEYCLNDSDIIYRVNFFSADGSDSDRAVFNAVMDRLAFGK